MFARSSGRDVVNEGRLRQLADGVYAWIGTGGDSNAGAIATPHGWLAIDAQQNLVLAESFRRALESTVSMPVLALINTHYHLDHIAGNPVFADRPVISHKRTLEGLVRELGVIQPDGVSVADPLSKVRLFFGANFTELVGASERDWFLQRVGGDAPVLVRPPSVTFADEMIFLLQHDVMSAAYWGPAHCDGDLIIHLKKAGVVFLADLFFHGRFPWFGDCDLDGWIAVLDRVTTIDAEVVVPGHGAPTTMTEVVEFRDLLAAVRQAAADAVKKGLSEEAASAEIHFPQYAAMPRYKEWAPFNVRAAYRYVRGA